VIFFYLILELTPKTQVSDTMNTVGISSNDKYLLLLLTDVQSALHQHARRLADEYATDSLPHRWCCDQSCTTPWLHLTGFTHCV